MKNKNGIRNTISRLTAKEAFELYWCSDEKMFISNFYYNNPPITNIKDMCRIYAAELPGSGDNDILFSLEELKHIEKLLLEHLENYVDSKGGIDNVDVYTEEELDKIDEEQIREVKEFIAEHYRSRGINYIPINEINAVGHINNKDKIIECNLYFTDLDTKAQEELLDFGKKDYLERYGDEDILEEVEALKEIGMEYETLLSLRVMEHMKSYKFIFHM
ncbi:MAG: hypothetical protein GX974_03595 [Clostridiales bacterium]|nr:hypothetical protein [Clostridiales bacterium]